MKATYEVITKRCKHLLVSSSLTNEPLNFDLVGLAMDYPRPDNLIYKPWNEFSALAAATQDSPAPRVLLAQACVPPLRLAL